MIRFVRRLVLTIIITAMFVFGGMLVLMSPDEASAARYTHPYEAKRGSHIYAHHTEGH